jgi:hypothetical protein
MFLMPKSTSFSEKHPEMDRVEDAYAQTGEILRIAPGFSLENRHKTVPFGDPKHLEQRLTALSRTELKK